MNLEGGAFSKMGEEASEIDDFIIGLNPPCQCVDCAAICKKPPEPLVISARKQKVLSVVSRTENYLRDRRVPELMRYLITKVIAHAPDKPIEYLETLLDDCMLFRAGHGIAPVVYEKRHLEAVIKSFDPGDRGWLSAGQVRRLYMTLGLDAERISENTYPTDILLNKLISDQENELHSLLSAGIFKEGSESVTSKHSSSN